MILSFFREQGLSPYFIKTKEVYFYNRLLDPLLDRLRVASATLARLTTQNKEKPKTTLRWSIVRPSQQHQRTSKRRLV